VSKKGGWGIMTQDYNKIAKDIFDAVKQYGIVSADICMTRLRIKLKNKKVDLSKFKKIPGVMSVVAADDEFQFVIGPGVVKKVYASYKQLLATAEIKTEYGAPSLKEIANQVKNENKSKRQSNLVAIALSKFAKIFTPLIPAFIAAGILAGVAGILQSIYTSVLIDGTRA
jgi:phosphotransferase system IIB component